MVLALRALQNLADANSTNTQAATRLKGARRTTCRVQEKPRMADVPYAVVRNALDEGPQVESRPTNDKRHFAPATQRSVITGPSDTRHTVQQKSPYS